MSDKLKYYACVAGLFAVTMGVRYAYYWSPDPVSPGIPAEESSSPAIVSQDAQQTIWEIPFVTLHSFDDATGEFTGTRTEPHYGLSEVLIPADRVRGSLNLVSTGKPVTDSTIQRAGDREFLPDKFFSYLEARLNDSEQKDVLIFVHGFNVGFHEAVCRAAQMAHDMPFSGVMIAYDWNSADNPLRYLHDRQSATKSAPHLATFLAELRARLGEEIRLHVLAHSMGNHVVLSSLNLLTTYQPLVGLSSASTSRLVGTSKMLDPPYRDWERWHSTLLKPLKTPPITHLILAAPDVNPQTFREVVDLIRPVTKQITIYCSESDFALDLSRYANGQGKNGYRLGDSRSGPGGDRVDVVRLQGVSQSDTFGHSYYGSHPRLLTDLSILLKEDRTAGQRHTITAGTWMNSGNWYLR